MALLEILEAYIFTGVTSNATFAVLQKVLSIVFRKTPGELFLDSIDETIRLKASHLKRLTKDGDVKFHRNRILIQDSGIQERSLSVALETETEKLDRLTLYFIDMDLIEIGGHQLDRLTHLALIKDILAEAKQKFYSKLAQNQIAFNTIILSETENNSHILREIHLLLNIHNNAIASKLDNISSEIELLRSDIEVSQASSEHFDESLLLSPNASNLSLANPSSLSSIPVRESHYPQIINPPDYLKSLQDEILKKGYIERPDVMQELKNLLAISMSVAIVGEPGIGKTFLMGRLSELNKSIYISLKGQTAFYVYSYLIDRIRVLHSESPIHLSSELEARWMLETELSRFPVLIFIDDVDYEVSIAQSLLSLHRTSAILVLSARSVLSIRSFPVTIYEVPPLSPSEVQSLISNLRLDLESDKIEELRVASNGNPLYLYYYSIEQINPLPRTILSYQEAIWRSLSEPEKEVLIFLSISFSPRTAEELHYARNKMNSTTISIMGTFSILEKIKPLVSIIDRRYIPFHPAFADFIEEYANRSGIIEYFHKFLGDAAINNSNILDATYHFMHAKDNRANPYYLSAAQLAFSLGYYKTSEDFLQKNLEVIKDSDKHAEIGQTYFMLANIYSFTSRVSDAIRFSEIAIEYFLRSNDMDMAKHIESWSSATFVYDIDPEIAIKKSQAAIEYFSGKDLKNEGVALVNFSNLLVQISRYKEGLKTAEKAYNIFDGLNDQEGIIVSMTNIAACLGGLEDRDQELKYANLIIEMAEKLGRTELKAVGLNHLAICQRHNRQLAEAIASLTECIKISRNLGDIARIVLNTNNLGNVYFDLNDFDRAMQYYLDALELAREHHFVREQARSLELMARVQKRKDNTLDVLKLSQEALALYEYIKDYYHVASVLEYIGWSYNKISEHLKAAESYKRAAEIYLDFDMPKESADSFDDAGRSFLASNDIEHAIDCLDKGIELAINSQSIEELSSLLGAKAKVNISTELIDKYIDLLKTYTTDAYKENFAASMLTITACLKQIPDTNNRVSLFKKISRVLLESAAINPNFRCLNALALLLEQSDERIADEDSIDDIVARVSEILDGFYYRRVNDEREIYTIGLRWKNNFIAQIDGWISNFSSRTLSFAIAMILFANKDLLGSEVANLGNIKESYFMMTLLSQSDFETYIQALDPDEKLSAERPFTISMSNVPWDQPQPESIAVFLDSYSQITDWSTNPENKSHVWLLMVLYGALIGHTIHQDRDKLAKNARLFVEKILN